MKNVFLGLILTLIFGGAAVAASAQTAQQVSLRLNKQKMVTRDRLKIKFVAVEDSRCPQDVTCVWAGNAKVTVKIIDRRGKSETFELNTNLEAKAVRFAGYEIKLINVTPYPRSNIRINPNGYTAKFTVTKL